jgi:hypothetical protein
MDDDNVIQFFFSNYNCIFQTLRRNITSTVGVGEVEPIFSAFGPVQRCLYVEDTSQLSSIGIATKTALVEYADSQTAATVSISMKNFNLAGLPLLVQLISAEQANLLIPSATPAALAKAVAAASKAAASAAAALANSSSSSSLSSATESYSSLILQNMVSAKEAEDPDLKDEIAEEVSKYGKLASIDITVEIDSKDATIVLKYESPSDAACAHQALQGRAFANKKIIATLAP